MTKDAIALIRANLTPDQISALNAEAPLGSGVKVACEIALGVRPGCEPALDAALDVVAAAIACGYPTAP